MNDPVWLTLKNMISGSILQTYVQDIGDYWLSVFNNPETKTLDTFSKNEWEIKILMNGVRI